MNRGTELVYSLGWNILFPRLCLFVLLPCAFCLGLPPPPAIPWLLRPGTGIDILAVCLTLFGLSAAANLSTSRYLRLAERPHSPYRYAAEWDWATRSSYFRIQITDKAAFDALLRDRRRQQLGQAFWLTLDNLLYAPPVLLAILIALVVVGIPLLIRMGWQLSAARKYG